jgi:hypothetical protein
MEWRYKHRRRSTGQGPYTFARFWQDEQRFIRHILQVYRKEKNMPKKSDLPILKALEELYEKEREKIVPLYPYNKKTGKIELPRAVIADLKFFLLVGNTLAAVKRVAELTGAGLRRSKDYVDHLQKGGSV